MMRSPIGGIAPSAPSTTARSYSYIFGSGGGGVDWGTSDSRRLPVSFPHRLLNLYVLLDVAPGAGKSWKFTVRVNGNLTPLSVTISDAATASTPTTAVVVVGDGDEIDLVCDPTGTPTAPTRVKWSLETEAARSFPIYGGTNSSPPTSGSSYKAPRHGTSAWETTSTSARQIVPINGRVRNLRVRLANNPGTGKSWVVTLYKNGSPTSITATATGAATAALDITHQVVYAPGDTWSIEVTAVSTPGSSGVSWCMEFVPDTPGECFLAFGNSDPPNTGTQRYQAPGGSQGTTWSATEAARTVPVGAGYTMKAIYALVGTAPDTGAGVQSWTLLMRVAGADSAVTTTIADAATTNQATGLSVAPNEHDLIAFSTKPSGTPAAMTGGAHIGVALSKATTPTPGGLSPAV